MATLPNFNAKFWFVTFNILSILIQSHCRLSFYEQCVGEMALSKNSNATQLVLHIDDPRLKCIDACILKRIGMMKNGQINEEITFDILKKTERGGLSNLRVKTSACAAKANKATNECEAGSIMRRCLAKES